MSSPQSSLVESERTIGSTRTRVIETSGTGPVLLLLHGFSDSAVTWNGVLEELARLGCRAVAVDLPGHGRAEPLPPGPVLAQLEAFAAEAVARWTEAGRPPIVVGNSLGAIMAIRVAQERPASVAAIVPIAPAGFGHAWHVRILERYHHLNPLLFQPFVPMSVFQVLAARAFAFFAGGGSPLVPGTAATYAAQFRRSADVARLLGLAPLVLAELPQSALTRARIQVPTHVVWGRRDRMTLATGAEPLRNLCDQASVTVLDDAGHCLQLQVPAVVAAQLARIAAGVRAAESAAG